MQRVPIWGWWLIAIAVGAVMGWAWTSDPGGTDPLTWDINKFMRNVTTLTEKGESVVNDIVIEPPFVTQRIKGREQLAQRVSFNYLGRRKDTGKWEVRERPSVIVDIPLGRNAPNPDFRISDWLDQQKQRIPSLTYRKAWWKVAQLPPAIATKDRDVKWWQVWTHAIIVSIAASIVLIGILWPMLIRVLVKLGLGLPEDDLPNLSDVRVQHAGAAAKVGETDADRQKLADLNAELEEKVAGMVMSEDKLDEAEEKRAEAQVIRQLNNQPGETKTPEQIEQEAREFKGEFYPVARPVTKKDDEE
jgi:hypothetical protein